MTRPLWAAICCMLVGASNAVAQGTPVFTEKTVHPFEPPVLGATRDGSLIVTAPSGVGSGLTLLALSIEDAPPSR